MTIIRAEQPLTYPKRHNHQHAGRVAWWLRDRESWGCVFERGPAAEPAPGVDSGSGEPESLGLPDPSPDKTHFPFPPPPPTTLVLPMDAHYAPFWRTQTASGHWVATPVADDLTEALQSAVAAPTDAADG